MFNKLYQNFLSNNESGGHYENSNHLARVDISKLENILIENSNDLMLHTQKLIAEILTLPHPENLFFFNDPFAFWDLFKNIFSNQDKISVLLTEADQNCFFSSSEFDLTVISTMPFDQFEQRLINKIKSQKFDIVFISQVFSNSGMAINDLEAINQAAIESEALIVLNAKRSFYSMPTKLATMADSLLYFYHSDEMNIGFVSSPKCYTSFFTSTSTKECLFRFNSALNIFKQESISVEMIHQHIQQLQFLFRQQLITLDHPFLCEKNIISFDYNHHGHQLTFALPSPHHAKLLHAELKSHHITTEIFENRLSFHFDLFQEEFINLEKMGRKND